MVNNKTEDLKMFTVASSRWVKTKSDGQVKHINDVRIVNGTFETVSDKKAKAQILEAAIRTRLGEMPLDTARGIPYFDTAFLGRFGIDSLRTAIKERIQEFDFVDNVESLEVTAGADGIFRYVASIRTTEGEMLELAS